LLPTKKLHELIDGQSSIGDDAPQRASSNLLVVRDDDPSVRLDTTKDHMAAGLSPKYEASALQCGTNSAS
jgi:hypothetical protein